MVDKKEHAPGAETLFSDRKRTNLLRGAEQATIRLLLKRVPKNITPNVMTAIGAFGSMIVFGGFYLSLQNGKLFLLGGVLGLAINWLGDSLDGRLAYYRHIPRKWYGFALDILMDWLSIIMIGLGFYFYAELPFKILAFLFVVLYGWSMLIALLRYHITGKYQIDAGAVGPTELRIIIAMILIVEIVYPGSINYLAVAITIALFVVNLIDTFKLLDLANNRDEREKKNVD